MSDAWGAFLDGVAAARTALAFQPDEECFYRGHSDENWPLVPSLLREFAATGRDTTDLSGLRDFEAMLFFEFRARARDLHERSTSDWDILFSMQHHGVPTRLLDWTEHLGIAVYFALRDAKPGTDACVWLLNPYGLNETSWSVRDLVSPEYLAQGDHDFGGYLVDYSETAGFDWDEPVALYPAHRNARLHAQRGYFTIYGERTLALDGMVPQQLRRVVLPQAAWSSARGFLEDAGMDEQRLFPDLDGLARFLRSKYCRRPGAANGAGEPRAPSRQRRGRRRSRE